MFVGAGVGKYHTILVADDGRAYASGGNLCGQLGINNEKVRGVEKFRRCVVVAGGGGLEEDGGVEDGGGVRIVQVSFFVGRSPPPRGCVFFFRRRFSLRPAPSPSGTSRCPLRSRRRHR